MVWVWISFFSSLLLEVIEKMPKGKGYSFRNPPASEITGKSGGSKGGKKVTMKKVMKSKTKKAGGSKNKGQDY